MNYLEKNRASWNERTKHHIYSEFYNLEGFMKGETSLKEIELKLLGDVKGKSVLHLQCHFGQDSLSLVRMGAKVTGIDLSDEAIKNAQEINEKLGLDATFICCDIYDLPKNLTEKFDIVFTTYGTIGWLPDINKWADIVSQYMNESGKFIFVEFHPVIWMYDNDFKEIEYNYFNDGPIIETLSGTYADKNAPIECQYYSWNHSLGEVITALMNQNLNLNSFQEYDFSPYDCLSNMIKIEENKYHIERFGNKIPMVYSLVAERKK
jgi:SAM-dependent methyltransferase